MQSWHYSKFLHNSFHKQIYFYFDSNRQAISILFQTEMI